MSVESELYSLPNLMPTVYDSALLLNWIMFQLQKGGGGGGNERIQMYHNTQVKYNNVTTALITIATIHYVEV